MNFLPSGYRPPTFKETYGTYGNYLLERLRKGEDISVDDTSASKVGDGYASGKKILKNTSFTKTVAVSFHIPKGTGEIHHYDLSIYQFKRERSKQSDPSAWAQNELTLRSDEVVALSAFLDEQNELIGQRIEKQHATVVFSDQSDIQEVLRKTASLLSSDKHGEKTDQLLDGIIRSAGDGTLLTLGFTKSQLQKKRNELDELRAIIDSLHPSEVNDIQAKLKMMPWIFGPEYVSYDYKKAGDQIPDGRLKRVDGLSDVLEVKLPSEEVLRVDGKGRHYLSPKCAESLGQLIGYLEYYYSQYRTEYEDDSEEEILDDKHQSYYRPKGILLIGRREKTDSHPIRVASGVQPKHLRRQLSYFHGIEILTYDDLLERAKNGLDNIEGSR